MKPSTTIIGQVRKYGEDCTTVVLTLQADELDWSEFSVGHAAFVLESLEPARRGERVLNTHPSIPLASVQRVETSLLDSRTQPALLSSLRVVSRGLWQ